MKQDKNKLKKTWENIWINYNKCEMEKHNKQNKKNNNPNSWWTYTIAPTPHKEYRNDYKHHSRFHLKLLNLSRLNKLYLNDLLYSAKLKQTNICKHCNENKIENIYHYFFHCKHYEKQRDIMWKVVKNNLDPDIHELDYHIYNYHTQLHRKLLPISSSLNSQAHRNITNAVIKYIISTKRFQKHKLLSDLAFFKHC